MPSGSSLELSYQNICNSFNYLTCGGDLVSVTPEVASSSLVDPAIVFTCKTLLNRHLVFLGPIFFLRMGPFFVWKLSGRKIIWKVKKGSG